MEEHMDVLVRATFNADDAIEIRDAHRGPCARFKRGYNSRPILELSANTGPLL